MVPSGFRRFGYWFDYPLYPNDQCQSLFVEWLIQNPIFHPYIVLILSEAVEASWCLFFLKLVNDTQISNPPEATRHHNSIKLLILLPLRADLLYILHYETPCKTHKSQQFEILITNSGINSIIYIPARHGHFELQ